MAAYDDMEEMLAQRDDPAARVLKQLVTARASTQAPLRHRHQHVSPIDPQQRMLALLLKGTSYGAGVPVEGATPARMLGKTFFDAAAKAGGGAPPAAFSQGKLGPGEWDELQGLLQKQQEQDPRVEYGPGMRP